MERVFKLNTLLFGWGHMSRKYTPLSPERREKLYAGIREVIKPQPSLLLATAKAPTPIDSMPLHENIYGIAQPRMGISPLTPVYSLGELTAQADQALDLLHSRWTQRVHLLFARLSSQNTDREMVTVDLNKANLLWEAVEKSHAQTVQGLHSRIAQLEAKLNSMQQVQNEELMGLRITLSELNSRISRPRQRAPPQRPRRSESVQSDSMQGALPP